MNEKETEQHEKYKDLKALYESVRNFVKSEEHLGVDLKFCLHGSTDGTVAVRRPLTSHQCGPRSIPRLSVTRGLIFVNS